MCVHNYINGWLPTRKLNQWKFEKHLRGIKLDRKISASGRAIICCVLNLEAMNRGNGFFVIIQLQFDSMTIDCEHFFKDKEHIPPEKNHVSLIIIASFFIWMKIVVEWFWNVWEECCWVVFCLVGHFHKKKLDWRTLLLNL